MGTTPVSFGLLLLHSILDVFLIYCVYIICIVSLYLGRKIVGLIPKINV